MENIIALIAATIVPILIPGPSVALIVANSLRDGMRIGVIKSLGTAERSIRDGPLQQWQDCGQTG